MTTGASQRPRVNEYVYTPPILPTHLSSIYNLQPIAGQPTDEQVKVIHAVIGAVDAGARVPNLYGPDLSLQLSQHLFSVQMGTYFDYAAISTLIKYNTLAVYRGKYPVNVFPGDNTYTPPSLPAYIPVELEPVVGTPAKEQLRAAQNAMRAVESLGSGPLFDSDLNMQLSQHVFNLQFAQYIQDSTTGEFVPKPAESQRVPSPTQGSPNPPMSPNLDNQRVPSKPIRTDGSEAGLPQPSGTESTNLGSHATTEIIQQGEVMRDMKELMSESKGVLENINRVLIATQRSQNTISVWNSQYIVHVNPVNEQGILATECGLPQLRYFSHQGSYGHYLDPASLAGYLKFFNIGADLLEDDESPRLKAGDNRPAAAWTRISKHLGLAY